MWALHLNNSNKIKSFFCIIAQTSFTCFFVTVGPNQMWSASQCCKLLTPHFHLNSWNAVITFSRCNCPNLLWRSFWDTLYISFYTHMECLWTYNNAHMIRSYFEVIRKISSFPREGVIWGLRFHLSECHLQWSSSSLIRWHSLKFWKLSPQNCPLQDSTWRHFR